MNSAPASSRSIALLYCGVVAGPLYVSVTLLQALTREGFDITAHRFTLLTAGDLGWVHQINMILVGTLTMLFAIGMRRLMSAGRLTWAPWAVGLLGGAYSFGGLFSADPVAGMPPGTDASEVTVTLQGQIQNVSRGASTLFLLLSSGLLALWFHNTGQTLWAWICALLIPFAAMLLIAFNVVIGGNPAALAFLITPWIWVTVMALRFATLQQQTN